MANKPQTLSQGQRAEVVKIIRNQVLAWTLVAFAIVTGITGVGLWQIYSHVQKNMENLVARQFEEPRITLCCSKFSLKLPDSKARLRRAL
jgi:hypothetical protein